MVNENTLPMALPVSFETGDYRPPPRSACFACPGTMRVPGDFPVRVMHWKSFMPYHIYQFSLLKMYIIPKI